jgi:hypothetical protein
MSALTLSMLAALGSTIPERSYADPIEPRNEEAVDAALLEFLGSVDELPPDDVPPADPARKSSEPAPKQGEAHD